MILWFIGLAIFTYYSQNPDASVTSGDTAFFTFIATKLPTPVPGLIMAAMLAAVMSTLDSGINSLSAIWLKEFHMPYINSDLSDEKQVKVLRIATTLIGVFAVGVGILITQSSNWLGQTVVESATIFHAFEVIVLPAFLYAVLSKRANSILIWIIASLLWGMKFAMLTWYVITKKAAKDWVEGTPRGLAGPIESEWVIYPLLAFAVMVLFWMWRRKVTGEKCLVTFAASLFPLGYATGTFLWYIFSNMSSIEGPLELSFQWVGFPVTVAFIVLGIIGLKFSKVQPEKKYKGLTLSTLDEAIEE
jgi:Na+/proline symporter